MSGTDGMIECVGWTLLHFLWEGLVIAIVLAILLRALRKASANSRYMAGCVALALMIAAPVGTYVQLAKKPATVSPIVFRMPTENVAVETTPRIISIQPTKVAVTEQKKSAVTLSWSERLTPLLPLLVAGWAMGVIVLALRLSAGWLRVKRLKRLGTESMEEVWQERLAKLTRRLRINRSVRLVKSALVEVPTVIGWLRPIILMPAGCLAGLSAAQVEYILAHELAHVRRHDYLVNLLQCLAETILFYHPVVWWVSRRIREEREHCCDDVAVSVCGNRLEYARTLAALEELRGSQNQLVMAAAGAPLLQRIRRLVGQSERNPSHPVWPLAAIVILVLVATLGIGFRSSRAIADETQGSILRTNRQATAIVKSDSQAQAEAFAGQGGSANQTAPQIHIEAKFFELEERDLPKSIFNLPGASNAVPTSIQLTIPKHPSQVQVLANVTNSIVQSFAGILSEPDYQKALKAFKAAQSVNILSPPSVTTLVGRQAEMFVGDAIPILTNNSPTATATLMPLGVMFDVTPTLAANGTRLQLAMMATVAKRIDAPTTVTPPVEVAQLSMDAASEDGQTLVMGGFMAEVVTKMTDKVAVLGSIPLAGRLFRSESVSKSRKYLIVLATPTLINADGSRYRPDNETSRKASKDQSKQDQGKVHITIGGTNELSQDGSPGFAWHRRDAARGSDSRTNAQEAPKQQSANTLGQDGKLLFESGKSDAAEAKFQEALKLDPNNAAASYYLGLVRQKRDHAGERRGDLQLEHPVLKWDAATASYVLGGAVPLPNFTLRTNSVKTGRGRQAILSKLDRIRVDSIEYDGLPLAEVIKNLSEIAKTRDPDRTGINFFINRETPATATSLAVPGAIDPTTGLPVASEALPTEPVDVGGVTVKISPALTNVCLADVLDAITKTSDKPIKYSVEDYAVVFSLKGPETVLLFTRVYHIDPIKFRHGLEAVGVIGKDSIDSQGGGGKDGSRNVVRTNSYEDIQIATRNLFTAAGVDFNPANPANVGKALFFNERKGILSVHTTQKELDLVDKLLAIINTPEGTDSGVRIRNRAPLVLSGNSLMRSGVDSDMLYSDAKDRDAVERIVQEIDALTPETQSEENLIKTDKTATQQAQLPAGVARTNLVKTIKGRKEIISVLNRIRAQLTDYDGLTLQEAVAKLSQTIKSGNPDQGGVTFFIDRSAPPQLLSQGKGDPASSPPPYLTRENDDLGTKVLKLPQQRAEVPLASVLDCIATNNSLQYAIEDSAVVFSVRNPEPAPMYTRVYHISTNRLNSAWKQLASSKSNSSGSTNADLPVDFRTLFNAAGVDFSPTNPANAGKSLFYKDRKGMLMVHATTQDLDRIEKVLERINTVPPQINIKARFVEMDDSAAHKIKWDGLMRSVDSKTHPSMTEAIPTNIPVIVVSPQATNSLTLQFTGLLTAEHYKEIVTRLEQSDAVDILTAPDVTTESGRRAQIQSVDIRTVLTGLTTVYTNGTATNIYSSQTLPFGPVIDILPRVSEDGSNIQMDLTATVTEFLGYDDPRKLAGPKRTDVQIPLPQFKLRQLTCGVSVGDGETIVLGGSEQSGTGKRGREKQGKRKTLLVFVTPTLINADGSLYHSKVKQEAALQEGK